MVAALSLVATACGGSAGSHPSGGPRATGTTAADPTGGPEASGRATAPVFAYYYLWWDAGHWRSHLGPAYPTDQAPLPLPATLDAHGCGTVNGYPGNVLTDVSQGLAYDQSDPRTIVDDVERAADAGLRGFAVNWIGDGTTDQSPTSSTTDERLAAVFDAVHRVNAEGKQFSIVVNYQSSAKSITTDQFTADFEYLLRTYGDDPALDHTWSPRPEVIAAGTWKYSDEDLATVSERFRSRLYLLGDEKPASWSAARAALLDGTTYYWSSQDPTRNPSSFAQLRDFASTVRSTTNPDGSPKTWLAPFTPGYNAMLLYDSPTCVPRDDGRTMHALFDGNGASEPDGWTFISWNEISEGSYVVPLTRYGTKYVDELRSIVGAGA